MLSASPAPGRSSESAWVTWQRPYDVNLGVVEDVVANRLDDLLAFAEAVRARLP